MALQKRPLLEQAEVTPSQSLQLERERNTFEELGIGLHLSAESYTNVLANQSSQNYTATAIIPTISGNAGVAGATLSYTDGTSKTATADVNGNYSFPVSYNWSGTVTLQWLVILSCLPVSLYNIMGDWTNQNFTTLLHSANINVTIGGVPAATISCLLV